MVEKSAEWIKPIIFDLKNDDDIKNLELLKKSDTLIFEVDGLNTIANNLFELEYPNKSSDKEARLKYISSDRFSDGKYGVWVYFPWSHELVRYPEPYDYYCLRTYRFKNLITKEEQDKLRGKRIAVIGMSVGSNLALSLARNCLCGSIVLADYASPNVSNIGRAEFYMSDLCNSKLSAIAKRISYIDPFMEQLHLSEGFNLESSQKLREWKPDIICDEVDDMKASATIRKFSRKERFPYITVSDVHDRAVLEVCRHDLADNRRLYAGTVSDKKAEKLLLGQLTHNEEMLLFGQTVGFHRISADLVDSDYKIGKSLSGIPQLGTTSVTASAIAAVACRDILLNRKVRTGISQFILSKATKKSIIVNFCKLIKISRSQG